MRRVTGTAILLLLTAFIAHTASAETSAIQCEEADASGDVTLKFCAWNNDGVWNVSPKVRNGAATKKVIAVKCRQPGVTISNVLIDAYESGAERSIFVAKLPASIERPKSFCKLDSVEDYVPKKAGGPEEQ